MAIFFGYCYKDVRGGGGGGKRRGNSIIVNFICLSSKIARDEGSIISYFLTTLSPVVKTRFSTVPISLLVVSSRCWLAKLSRRARALQPRNINSHCRDFYFCYIELCLPMKTAVILV